MGALLKLGKVVNLGSYSRRPYNNIRKGWYKHNGKEYYMKSNWEYNYACYLDFLKGIGEIVDWEYEADSFYFNKIRSGVRKYTPDFKVYLLDGSIEYREVKGWMDGRSRTKIRRFRKYYSGERLVVVGKREYNNLKKIRGLIKNWRD